MAQNRYNDFPCHKTADYHEDEYDSGFVHGEKSLTCHGFKTLQMSENSSEAQYKSQGFEPDGKGFTDFYQMVETHQEIWDEHTAPTGEEE